MLLYGLYDENHNIIHSCGLNNRFIDAVDDYMLRMDYRLSDLYAGADLDSNRVSGTVIVDMIYMIGLDFGLSSIDVLSILHDLGVHHGVPRNPLNQSGDDDDDDGTRVNWGWFITGFDSIFGQSIDFNVNYLRYLDSRYDADLDAKVRGDSRRDILTPGDSPQDPTTGDYIRRERIKATHGVTATSISHLQKIGLLLSYIYYNDDEDLAAEKYYGDLYESHINDIIHNWGVCRSDLRNDPILFNDMMALAIDRTLDDLNPTIEHSEGAGLLPWLIDMDDDGEYIDTFADSYMQSYGVPIDASLYTINEVNVMMNRDLFDEQYGSLAYHDVYSIKSEADLARFAKDNNYQVDYSKMKSMSDVVQKNVDHYELTDLSRANVDIIESFDLEL